MSQTASPCAVDTFLETLMSESDRSTLRPLSEMLGLRHAFVTREPGGPGGLEATFLSPRHLVPVRQLEGGRLDVRVIPLALVLTVAFREEPTGLECQLDLYQSSPIVLSWPGATLASVAEDKAFRLLMTTCGFASRVPESAGRPGFRGL
jgi:hypothetical protein